MGKSPIDIMGPYFVVEKKSHMNYNEKLNIITVLEGRTQAVIRDHFLKYDRAVRCRVKIITMDMFSPYYDLAK